MRRETCWQESRPRWVAEACRSGRYYTHRVRHCSPLSGSAQARYPLGVLRGQNAAAHLPAVLTVLPALPHALVQDPLAVAKHQAPGPARLCSPGRHPRLSALAPRTLSVAPAPGPPDGTCQARCRSMCKAAPHACCVQSSRRRANEGLVVAHSVASSSPLLGMLAVGMAGTGTALGWRPAPPCKALPDRPRLSYRGPLHSVPALVLESDPAARSARDLLADKGQLWRGRGKTAAGRSRRLGTGGGGSFLQGGALPETAARHPRLHRTSQGVRM